MALDVETDRLHSGLPRTVGDVTEETGWLAQRDPTGSIRVTWRPYDAEQGAGAHRLLAGRHQRVVVEAAAFVAAARELERVASSLLATSATSSRQGDGQLVGRCHQRSVIDRQELDGLFSLQ